MEFDTGFRPSRNGFAFANAWRDLIFGVVASRGRCGGTVFAALDYYESGKPLPAAAMQKTLPPHGSVLARFIWRRQIASVMTHGGDNLRRFAQYTYLPSVAAGGISEATLRDSLVLFDRLRAGSPVPLGLVSAIGLAHLPRNHQVLAYAAEFTDERVLVRVYDPNYPRRDDVTLDMPLKKGAPLVEHIGVSIKVWRGMFVERRSRQWGRLPA